MHDYDGDNDGRFPDESLVEVRCPAASRKSAATAAKKYDTSTTVLACYSAAGFDQDLRDQAARAPHNVLLVGPEELYAP
jgi:hypothetical protein